jgi:HPt (histidine-containing phosphotransfer) domain-containing protein
MGTPLFDASVLERLAAQAKGHGDTRLVIELVHDALASIQSLVAEIEDAATVRDLPRLRSSAHRIKGVLRQVGALRMGERTARVESLASEADESALAATHEILDLRDETLDALRAHLSTLG